MKLDFIVLGLPRSGTTWLANFLTTDTSLCLHDPFADGLPETWERDERLFGISCTGAYLFPGWLKSQACPIAVIERDPAECSASCERIGLGTVDALASALAAVDAPRWCHSDLWDEERARALWALLLPTKFDALRYRQLRRAQVQPYMPAWTCAPGVTEEMMRRE